MLNILLITSLIEPELISRTQLKGIKYCYITVIIYHQIFIYTDIWYVILFLNELQLICLHISIAVVSTLINAFKYRFLTFMVLFNINYLFAYSKVVTNIAI